MSQHIRPVVWLGATVLLVVACASGSTATVAPTAKPALAAESPSCAPAQAETSAPPAAETSAPPAAAAAVVVKGSGRQNTKPFTLGAGSYGITVKGESSRDNERVYLILYPVTPDPSNARDQAGWLLFNGERVGKGTYTLETNEYNLDGREYYLDANMPEGAWTVTWTPQP